MEKCVYLTTVNVAVRLNYTHTLNQKDYPNVSTAIFTALRLIGVRCPTRIKIKKLTSVMPHLTDKNVNKNSKMYTLLRRACSLTLFSNV